MATFIIVYLLMGLSLDAFMTTQPEELELDDITISKAIIGSAFFLIMIPYYMLKVLFRIIQCFIEE